MHMNITIRISRYYRITVWESGGFDCERFQEGIGWVVDNECVSNETVTKALEKAASILSSSSNKWASSMPV